MDGFRCSLISLILIIIKCLIKEKEEIKQNIYLASVPSIIEWKMTMDVRKIGKTNSVVLSLIPLNLRTFNPQNRECQFTLTLWLGEEKYVKYLVDDVKKITSKLWKMWKFIYLQLIKHYETLKRK